MSFDVPQSAAIWRISSLLLPLGLRKLNHCTLHSFFITVRSLLLLFDISSLRMIALLHISRFSSLSPVSSDSPKYGCNSSGRIYLRVCVLPVFCLDPARTNIKGDIFPCHIATAPIIHLRINISAKLGQKLSCVNPVGVSIDSANSLIALFGFL